ncbi:MAG: protease inhibitor I42 family protein [Dehalococcoidales bacterium]
MKKVIILGLVSMLLLPLLTLGCSGGGPQTITITFDEFAAQNNMVKTIELGAADTLTVKLDSNPTTGYAWEQATISNTAVITQTSHDYFAPTQTGIVGAGGTEVFVFKAKSAGTSTINFSYARSWEGGEKGIFTLTVNVTVK